MHHIMHNDYNRISWSFAQTVVHNEPRVQVGMLLAQLVCMAASGIFATCYLIRMPGSFLEYLFFSGGEPWGCSMAHAHNTSWEPDRDANGWCIKRAYFCRSIMRNMGALL